VLVCRLRSSLHSSARSQAPKSAHWPGRLRLCRGAFVYAFCGAGSCFVLRTRTRIHMSCHVPPASWRRLLAACPCWLLAGACACACGCACLCLWLMWRMYAAPVFRRTAHLAWRAAVTGSCTEHSSYIYEGFSINWSFLVAALDFVLAVLSSFVVSFYNKTPPQRRSHSRVFTPRSSARGGGGAQFCYPSGAGPDLAAGREVVSRCSVPILGLPSGDAFGPITPTDPPLHGH
jgi:hypothetical protein